MGNPFSEPKCAPDVRTVSKVKDYLNSGITTSIQITNFIKTLFDTACSYLKSTNSSQVLKCLGYLACLKVKLIILGTQLVFSIYSRYNAATLSRAFRHLEDLKNELNNANELLNSIADAAVDIRLRNKWRYFHKNSIDSIDAFIEKYYKKYMNFGWGNDYTKTFKTIEEELNQIIEFGEERSQQTKDFFSQLRDVKKRIAKCPEISCDDWKNILFDAFIDMILNTLVLEVIVEAFMLPYLQTYLNRLIKPYLTEGGLLMSKEFLEWLAKINSSNPEFLVRSIFMLPNLLTLLPKSSVCLKNETFKKMFIYLVSYLKTKGLDKPAAVLMLIVDNF